MYDDKNQGQENRQVNTYDPDQLYKGNARKRVSAVGRKA